MKVAHAQLNTETRQVIIQHAHLRNDRDKQMSPTEIERELNESTAINGNTPDTNSTNHLGQRRPQPHSDCLPQRDRRSSIYKFRHILQRRPPLHQRLHRNEKINRYLTHTPDAQLQPQTKVCALHQRQHQHSIFFVSTAQVRMQGMQEGEEMPARQPKARQPRRKLRSE